MYMAKKPHGVDEYIKLFPKEVQDMLQAIRQILRRELPESTEVISYGIPCFKVDGKYVVYFAGWKNHISLYPIPKGDAAFQKEIAPYKAGRGTLRFSLDKPIPEGLIKKVVSLLSKR